MLQLSTLPDVCLFNIFDRLTLSDQHQLGRVCHRLRLLQLSVNTIRKKLELLYRTYVSKLRNRNSIRFLNFSQHVCNQIIEHFPNVVKLYISNWSVFSKIDWTVNLLQHEWAAKLIYLDIHINYNEGHLNLIKAINSLCYLRYLSLTDNFPQNKSNQIDKLTIFPQLNHFVYKTLNCSNEILKLFKKFSNSTNSLGQLRSIKIDIDKIEWNHNNFQSFMSLSFEITSKINILFSIPHVVLENNFHLSRFCSHFSSLKYMEIVCLNDRSTIVLRLKCLAPLFQLRALDLDLRDRPITEQNNVEPKNLITFPFITYLRLKYLSLKTILSNLKLSTTFPNLESISIAFQEPLVNCLTCQQPFQGATEVHHQNCLLHMIEPLKKCDKLKSAVLHFYMSSKLFMRAHLKCPFNVVKINYER